jgi:hypothetical protein
MLNFRIPLRVLGGKKVNISIFDFRSGLIHTILLVLPVEKKWMKIKP